MNKIVEHIKEVYGKLKDRNDLKEENIKVNIVINIFLKELGYIGDLNLSFEDRRNPGASDITVRIPKQDTGGKEEKLIIETKNGYDQLDSKEIHQLSNYMGTEEWGILTNGIQYILINNKIDSGMANEELTQEEVYLSKVVFWFDLSKKRNYELKYFPYLSKKNIFVNRTTTYFLHIEQFKAAKFLKNSKSWANYKSTLFQFFDYYSQVKGKYRELGRIDTDDFIDFIEYKKKGNNGLPKAVTSKKTINNSFSYLNELFTTLGVKNESFSKGRENILKVFDDTELKKNTNYLDLDNINKIIAYLKTKETAARDIAIFVLCAYIGLERPKICNLKWSSIDLNHRLLLIDDRKIPMCSILFYAFTRLDEIRKQNKLKSEYIFIAYHLGKYNPCKESTINSIFNTFENIDSDTEKWKMFSPQYIRNSLFIRLFESGLYLDEIMYLTGIDLKNIGKYIPDNQIIDRQSKEKILSDKWRTQQKRIKLHPFDKAFNKDSYDF